MPIIIPYPNTVATLPGTFTYAYRKPLSVDGDSSGWTSTVRFFTDYANLGNFASSIAGVATVIATTAGPIIRILPLQHPLYTNLYATSLKSEAFGTPTGSALSTLWSKAYVDVTFQTVKYPTSGDTAYMTWEVDQGSTYSTLPGRKFRFSSNEPIDQDAGAFNVLNNYVLTIYQAANQNDATIDLLSGTVNVNPWMSRPAGTLLFGGCKSSLQISVAGVVQYQKSLVFTYRSLPWNQAYQRSGVAATPLDPAGNPQYPTGDFNALLTN